MILMGILLCVVTTVEGQSYKKTWTKNTNFDNVKNWNGFIKVCSKNIFSFPMSMESTVILFPKNTTIKAKEIILPRNGHLVFQSGLTTLFNSPSDTCQGIELKFQPTIREDWFDPDNWIENDDSLLNAMAIPHVERVPCQYDSAQFPSETSFNLFISSDVAVHKFLLGEEVLTYTDIAILMTTQLGKIQFLKNPETQFDLTSKEWEDNEQFICKNYQPEMKQKICSLADCPRVREGNECSNPLIPHGFCCPICGFHLKIQHSGEFRLSPVRTKLSTRLKSLNLANAVATHVTRNAAKWAHIIFIPWMNKTKDVRKLIDEIRSFLHDDPTVVETTLNESWNGSPDGTDKLTSSETQGSIVVLIIILILLTIVGALFFIFYWNRRGQGQPLTFNSILSRMPNINFPIAGHRPSFAFARFSNERISSINIGQIGSGNIERTDKVDSDTNPIDVEIPEGTSNTTGIGFANVVYDIIGVSEEATSVDSKFNTNLSSPKNMDFNDEHVYDLVEVNGGSSSSISDVSKMNIFKKEE